MHEAVSELIDPPSPFAPTQEWQDFLREMSSVNAPSPRVREMIALAKWEMNAPYRTMIERKHQEERPRAPYPRPVSRQG